MPIIAHLKSRALLAVEGEDWRGFLHNLITQDVETLQPGEIRFAGLLTPQGRLLFDLFVVGRAEGCFLDCDAERRASLLQRLSMYRLRAKVRLELHPGAVLAAWDGRPEGSGWSADPRLGTLGWRAYDLEPPVGAADESLYQARRLALGVPDPVADCPADKTYPIEADFDLLGGIDFKKGCFVGQETTSRMKRRGQIKSRMAPVNLNGPAAETEVLNGTLRAGEVTSVIGDRAMALLRLDRIFGDLTLGEARVSVDMPDWLRPNAEIGPQS